MVMLEGGGVVRVGSVLHPTICLYTGCFIPNQEYQTYLRGHHKTGLFHTNTQKKRLMQAERVVRLLRINKVLHTNRSAPQSHNFSVKINWNSYKFSSYLFAKIYFDFIFAKVCLLNDFSV